MQNARIVIGGLICAVVWLLFAARIIFGLGPMHDDQGNQAPWSHYLTGAVVATAMVAAWIKIRGRMEKNEE
jgi:hypothetical protein